MPRACALSGSGVPRLTLPVHAPPASPALPPALGRTLAERGSQRNAAQLKPNVRLGSHPKALPLCAQTARALCARRGVGNAYGQPTTPVYWIQVWDTGFYPHVNGSYMQHSRAWGS